MAEDYIYRFQHKERRIAHCYRWLDTPYFEMTGNQIDAVGIELLDAKKCDFESEDSLYSEKPYEPMMYCYENLSSTPKRVFEDIVERYQNFVQEGVQLDNN